MSQLTPGPWWPRYGGEWGRIYASTAQKVVAELLERSEGHPDARLIAAAPELLVACQQAIDFLRHVIDSEHLSLPDRHTQEQARTTEEALSQAIAKATGATVRRTP